MSLTAVLNVDLHGPASLKMARVLVEAVERVGLDRLFVSVGKKKFKKWSEVVAASEKLKSGDLQILGAPDAPDVELNLNQTAEGLTFFLAFGLEPEREALVPKLEKLVVALHEELCPRALMGPVPRVQMPELSYPRPRPPRAHPVWNMGSLVDFLCASFHRDHEDGAPADAKKLATAKLPKGAVREQAGDLTILRFLTGPPTEEALKAAAARQEQYITQALDPPRDPMFNELGDIEESMLSARSPAKPLTLFSDAGERGYKAIVPVKGKIDPDVAAELKKVLSRGKIGDGSRLSFLTLIVPNRDNAIALQKQANELGADQIIYPDATEEGVYWNPFPPGEWL